MYLSLRIRQIYVYCTVSIVTRSRGGQRSYSSIPGKGKRFFFSPNSQDGF